MNFPNLQDKVLVEGEGAFAKEADFNSRRDGAYHAAARGQMPFIAVDNTNQNKYNFALIQGYFCQTAQEISDAQARSVATGGTQAVYDVVNDVVYTYTGSTWVTAPTRNVAQDFGSGRMLFNVYTSKLFYVEGVGEIYYLNGAPWTA